MTEALIRSLPIWKHEIQIAPMEGGLTNWNCRVTDGEAAYAVRTGEDDPAGFQPLENSRTSSRNLVSSGASPSQTTRPGRPRDELPSSSRVEAPLRAVIDFAAPVASHSRERTLPVMACSARSS